jgi:hypothetical protein
VRVFRTGDEVWVGADQLGDVAPKRTPRSAEEDDDVVLASAARKPKPKKKKPKKHRKAGR